MAFLKIIMILPIVVLFTTFRMIFAEQVVSGEGEILYRFKRDEIEDVHNSYQEMVETAHTDDGSLDPSRVIRDKVTDPLPVQDFNVTIRKGYMSAFSKFWDLQIKGLRSTEVQKIKANISGQTLEGTVYTPLLRLDGQYDMTGKMGFINVLGTGDFWMNITEIFVFGNAKLNQSEVGVLEVETIETDIEIEDLKLHFDNLGGGYQKFMNSFVNQISGLMFQNIKKLMIREMENNMRKELNGLLARIPVNFTSPNSNSMIDGLIYRANEQIVKNNADPWDLPNHKDSFKRNFVFFTAHGELSLHDGILYGLSTLRRTGDIVATYENKSVILECNLGFENLTGSYNWWTKLMGVGPSGNALVEIKALSVSFRIVFPLQHGSTPTIETLEVENIGQIWIDVTGLGTWDFVLEIVMNLVTNSFKVSLANAIIGPVKEVLQEEVNNLPIMIL